jgi:hypothetical protein
MRILGRLEVSVGSKEVSGRVERAIVRYGKSDVVDVAGKQGMLLVGRRGARS